MNRHWIRAGTGPPAGRDIGPVAIGDPDPHGIGPFEGTLVAMAANVLGDELQPCSTDPLTGFYRDGCCNTGGEDAGIHTVCAVMTEDFLRFSASVGNDLSTPQPDYGFAGLNPGDQWCLCAPRWKEALDSGQAPPVVLASTHMATLEYVTLSELRAHAIDGSAADDASTGE